MCGINGFNFQDKNLILKMNNSVIHRGPDNNGYYLDKETSLGHTRLSIIDLTSSANQPMKSNDQKQVITFNGEIYNFNKLKEELKDFYDFRTNSDTEVILASYKKWGKNCVKKFNGIFALAIWDKIKKEIFLARDHIGVKPLYYYLDKKIFIFSSEIKAILELGITRVLNEEAFNHFFRILYVPEPLTMFKNIYKFPPGSRATFKNGKLNIERYWYIKPVGYLKEAKKEIAGGLKLEVLSSVKRQLISDRPVGLYLSGGIDSSSILSCLAQAKSSISTFSVGFELPEKDEKEKFNKDFNLARRTAKYYSTNHNEVLVSPEDILNTFEEAIWHLDEPISNPTIIPMFKLAKFAKNKVDVVLGGDGGDELFGGYERYRLSLISNYYQILPMALRKLFNFNSKLKKLNTPSGVDKFALFMFQKDNILKRALRDEYFNSKITKDFFYKHFFSDNCFPSFEEDFMNTDRKSWLVDDCLMRCDKMSMAAGLEQRAPLLDRVLVEFASRIPLNYKLNLFNKKIIMKEAFQNELPDFLFAQPKRGWFSPGAKWLRNKKIYELAQETLSESYNSNTAKIFNWSQAKEILKNHYNKKEYNLTIIWALLTFQIWAKKFNITV